MTDIVTKESLQAMLDAANVERKQHIIGRALVAIFQRQTNSEQATNSTDNLNGIGFAGSDAKGGSLTAKYYLKHKKLEQWQVDKWMKARVDGRARITKYVRQLNEIAQEKATQKANQSQQLSL